MPLLVIVGFVDEATRLMRLTVVRVAEFDLNTDSDVGGVDEVVWTPMPTITFVETIL